jgi:hypothetical protein
VKEANGCQGDSRHRTSGLNVAEGLSISNRIFDYKKNHRKSKIAHFVLFDTIFPAIGAVFKLFVF